MNKTLRRLGIVLLAALFLAGCASIDVDRTAAKPELDLRKFFSGTVDGWGMFQDRSGKVIKRFHVVIEAKWQGDTGTLDERFTWSDGEQGGNPPHRVWTLRDTATALHRHRRRRRRHRWATRPATRCVALRAGAARSTDVTTSTSTTGCSWSTTRSCSTARR